MLTHIVFGLSSIAYFNVLVIETLQGMSFTSFQLSLSRIKYFFYLIDPVRFFFKKHYVYRLKTHVISFYSFSSLMTQNSVLTTTLAKNYAKGCKIHEKNKSSQWDAVTPCLKHANKWHKQIKKIFMLFLLEKKIEIHLKCSGGMKAGAYLSHLHIFWCLLQY